MEPSNRYFKQGELLVQILPLLANYECFALKGGTAINLFVRDLPRLSVDIDVTYMPLKPRDIALKEIDATFRALKGDLEKHLPGVQVTSTVLLNSDVIYKLIAQLKTIQVKIETTPVMRGVVEESVEMEASPQTQEKFGYAKLPVVAFNDLYAGKLCAALSRQHPRDLFDVRQLLDIEGLSKELFEVFLIYLICSNKPIAELLAPREKDFKQEFMNEFQGMTSESVSPAMLTQTRSELIAAIRHNLGESHRQFLMSVKRGKPDWGLLSHIDIGKFPAVQWKLHNIANMAKSKHQAAIVKLEKVLYG